MYNLQINHQLVIVVVEATPVVVSRLLQAGQQSGLPLGVVSYNLGDTIAIRACIASCDYVVVTLWHLDTTSYTGTKFIVSSIHI